MASDPLYIKLYLDEDVHPDLADGIRQAGFDCRTAGEAGMLGSPDEKQLEYAASQDRCLVSFNVADFTTLAAVWAQAGKAHAGIVVTRQVSRKGIGKLLARLLHLLNTTTADEMANVLRYL
jgi:predicted nuclease of predicted toxin-antitoxin system